MVEIRLADIEGIAAALACNGVDNLLDGEDALRPAETTEGGIRDRVGLEPLRADFGSRQIIGIVGVEHRPVDDAEREIRRIAAACEVFEGDTLDEAVFIVADAVA